MIEKLVEATLGSDGAAHVFRSVVIDPALEGAGSSDRVTRAQFAMALNLILFASLLERVPTGAAYVEVAVANGEKITLDHGALRTIDGATGALPSGYAAFGRILEPLGYSMAGLYPLPKLRMTGRAFAHEDFPEGIPQFFVSELHVAEFEAGTRMVMSRVFDRSRDPLGETERAVLNAFRLAQPITLERALSALPGIIAAFDRQHDLPTMADYEALLAVSAEAAWIATEGNAFNHATTRVPNVAALAATLLESGEPLKAEVEISANRRVRQTAFIADKVQRDFTRPDGTIETRSVPGSFYEFISRDIDPTTGALDLSFDSGNATGIFAVTSAS